MNQANTRRYPIAAVAINRLFDVSDLVALLIESEGKRAN
jgi:hypothetical protein